MQAMRAAARDRDLAKRPDANISAAVRPSSAGYKATGSAGCEGRRFGQEGEGGIVRAATPRVRVRQRHGEGRGAEVRRASPDGPSGGRERDAAAARLQGA